jgi:hypothetical protein
MQGHRVPWNKNKQRLEKTMPFLLLSEVAPCTLTPRLTNTGRASTRHPERTDTKREKGKEIAITALLADREVRRYTFNPFAPARRFTAA